jgi:hypothetical protein
MPEFVTHLIEAIGRLLQRGGLWLGIGISLGLAAGSVLLAGAVVVRWPPDHFVRDRSADDANQHPVARALALVAKNLLGGFVILLGLVMALPGVPGQGLLMMIVGLTILDFPGKRRLERRVIAHPSVLRNINRLRARFDRPPLELEPDPSPVDK